MPPIIGQLAPDFTLPSTSGTDVALSHCRACFLIDRQGILRWVHVEAELGHRRDDDELLAQIAAL